MKLELKEAVISVEEIMLEGTLDKQEYARLLEALKIPSKEKPVPLHLTLNSRRWPVSAVTLTMFLDEPL